MHAKISKWGNSLAIRIPSSLARSTQLAEGEEVELKEEGDRIVLQPKRGRTYQLKALLSQVSPENLHDEVKTDQKGKEEW